MIYIHLVGHFTESVIQWECKKGLVTKFHSHDNEMMIFMILQELS